MRKKDVFIGFLGLTLGVAVGISIGLSFRVFQATTPLPETKIASSICSFLEPRFDPETFGNTILPKTSQSRRGKACSESVWYEMGRQGLGHRLGNYMASIALSITWGIPPLIGIDDCDRCGPHGCYSGAEDALGLSRGLERISTYSGFDSVGVHGWEHGTSLRVALAKGPNQRPLNQCKTLYLLGQDLWLRSLSIARSAITSQLIQRALKEHQNSNAINVHKLKSLPYHSNEVVIAVHLRYGGSGDRHKETSESWLKVVLKQLNKLAANKTNSILNYNRNGRKSIRPSSGISVSFHIFTGSHRFKWLEEIQNVVIHGSEVDATTTFRSLASADVLVCGHSSLCFHAALSQAVQLSLVPHNQEPFPYDMEPGDNSLVGPTGLLSNEQKLRFLDVIGRSFIARQYHCPLNPLRQSFKAG